ncbi:hypothetical protein B0J14DRAFT_430310, partial [Halenospora varia]
ASFNLNTAGPDWNYLASSLANTTSDACKKAYSATIACDPTLLGLVASMRPLFKPTFTDLDNTCTTSCKSSLEAYVQGVKDACKEVGDKAQEFETVGEHTTSGGIVLDSVWNVGEMFQYTLERDCNTYVNGTYCYNTRLNSASVFVCTDTCTAKFYQTSHDWPVSGKMFRYYYLTSRGPWWSEAFEEGWDRLKKCGIAKEKVVSSVVSTSTSASASVSGTVSASSSATITSVDSSTTSVGSGIFRGPGSSSSTATGSSTG